MKITYSWIKHYVPELDVPPQEFADRMTMSGTKVAAWERVDRNLEQVVIGQVKAVNRHPDAESLMLVTVDIGREAAIQCITSAENIRPGDKVAVALVGGKVVRLHDAVNEGNDGVRIRRETIRGIISEGVLCGVEELGFTREQADDSPAYEIYIFDEDAQIGEDAVEVLQLSDVLFTFEPTPARKDCFRVLGLAREVAAVFGLEFREPEMRFRENGERVEDYLSVRVRDGVACPRYCARVVKNIRIGPSPRWMQRWLISAGIRPVNNLVDITNFVMEEVGQPILAFDLESLSGHQLVLEYAEDGHKFRTLDGQLRNVGSRTLMLCDSQMPIGIAGIMGGPTTKVSGSGRTIVLEAACLDGAYIRRTSKRLGLSTEISRRFARGLDANYAEEGLNRACRLIDELGCGEVVGGMIDECSTVVGSRRISFQPEWVNRHLGTDISREEMLSILKTLGCGYDEINNDIITPVGRQDIESIAELAGEISRLYGYDRIPVTIPRVETTRGSLPLKMKIEAIAGNLAEFYGYSQIMTYSFDDPAVFDRLRLPPDSPLRNAVRIREPLSPERSILRTTSAGHMFSTLALNAARKHRHVCLYEMANIYLPGDLSREELPDVRMQFTLASYGRGDFFSLKGIVEEFLRRTGLKQPAGYDPASAKTWLHPGRQADILYEETVIGYIGEVHPLVAADYGIPERTVMAVIDMPEIVKRADFRHRFTGLNRYGRQNRDLNLLVQEEMPAAKVRSCILGLAGPALEKLELTDVYRGAQVEAGVKSMTWHLRFQASDHDISDDEVRHIMEKILRGLLENRIVPRR